MKRDSPHRVIRRNAAFTVLLVLLISAFPGSALAAELKEPLTGLSETDRLLVDAGSAYLAEARNSLWENNESRETVMEDLRRASSLFERIDDQAAKNYLLARVELNAGRAILGDGDERGARERFQQAMDLAESSLLAADSSEAWRVRADAGSSWMITKGLGGIIRMAPKIQDWSDTSLALDPDNALALIISAQGQINAPKGAGGDPEAAAGRLEDLLKRDDLDEIERFWGQISLAAAYEKLGSPNRTAAACRSAREIFPKNPMLTDCPTP